MIRKYFKYDFHDYYVEYFLERPNEFWLYVKSVQSGATYFMGKSINKEINWSFSWTEHSHVRPFTRHAQILWDRLRCDWPDAKREHIRLVRQEAGKKSVKARLKRMGKKRFRDSMKTLKARGFVKKILVEEPVKVSEVD